jgi:hypothetical protein
MLLPWGESNVFEGFVVRAVKFQNVDRNVYEWNEYFCERTGGLVERRIVAVNGNPVNDVHQMHNQSRPSKPAHRQRYTPFRNREQGKDYIGGDDNGNKV